LPAILECYRMYCRDVHENYKYWGPGISISYSASRNWGHSNITIPAIMKTLLSGKHKKIKYHFLFRIYSSDIFHIFLFSFFTFFSYLTRSAAISGSMSKLFCLRNYYIYWFVFSIELVSLEFYKLLVAISWYPLVCSFLEDRGGEWGGCDPKFKEILSYWLTASFLGSASPYILLLGKPFSSFNICLLYYNFSNTYSMFYIF